jgi:outer membrane protein assembly factor BamB
VSAQDGSIVSKRKVTGGVVIAPIVADEKVLVLSDAGSLIALR